MNTTQRIRYGIGRILAVAAVVTLTVITLSAAKPQLRAYGHIVGNFSRLDIAGTMNVECRHNPDSTGYVVFYTFPEFSKVLKVKNENGTLRLWTDADDITRSYFMNVIVYSGALDKIENGAAGRVTISSIKLNRKSIFDVNNNGSGAMTINTPITAKNISLRNTGSGPLVVKKPLSTNVINLIATGSGDVNVDGLSGVTLNIKNTGSTSVTVKDIQATDLNCTNSGSGTVTLSGTTINRALNNTGSGSINSSGLRDASSN